MNPAFSLAVASLSAELAWGAFGFQILIINIPTYIKKVKLSSNLCKCVTAQDLGSVSAAAGVSVPVNLGGRAPTVLSLMLLKGKSAKSQTLFPRYILTLYICLFLLFFHATGASCSPQRHF